MQRTRLAAVESSFEGPDVIRISRLPDGTTRWTGVLACEGGTLCTLSAARHRSVEDAEAEALRWARCNGAAEPVIAVE
jgi:hypothetical protein